MPIVEIRSLVKRYGQQAVLHGVDLEVAAGEVVAIIGRSGSGKSTLLKTFTRLLDPTTGAVLVDDFEARQYDPSDLRRAIMYMSQTPSLVDDTLLANMLPSGGPVDPARLEAVVRLTGVMDFVARHPKGYAMPLGPRGERLSGGERQSVALARLLLADPKVLVLDEPTASMDPILEARLVKQLPAEIGTRTLILATHRASMLELVDRVIWMDGGKIAADGPRAEVMARLSRAA
jgi:ATP-binding cassette subfamily C protein LapB